MFGKLTKAFDKAARKGNELINEAGRATQHKINSLRDHKELRDITVESKALPQMVQGFTRLVTSATVKLLEFSHVYSGAPADVVTKFNDTHERLQQASVASTQHLVAFTANIEEILKAEQATDAAAKAATKPPPEGQTAEQLKANEAAARNTLAEIKRKHIREAINGFVCAQIDLFAALEASMAQQIAFAETLPEAFSMPVIPFEGLFDEPRPAIGNSAAKPPPPASGEKRAPHEDFALLARPVDGDTRAKYAKIWNEAVRDVLEAHRLAMRETDKWFKLRLKLARHMEVWVASDPTNEPFKVAISCLPIFENQFLERHLPAYKQAFEALYPGLEAQRAPVPIKDGPLTSADPEVPKRRCKACKDALLCSLKATQGFAANGKVEAQQLFQASLGNLK